MRCVHSLAKLGLAAVEAALILAGQAGPALAQSYPQRPIQLIVPTGPGGTLDVSARLLASLWSETLGSPSWS